METISVTLTKEQLSNLVVFLGRSNANGMQEAMALVDLGNTIGQAKQEMDSGNVNQIRAKE